MLPVHLLYELNGAIARVRSVRAALPFALVINIRSQTSINARAHCVRFTALPTPYSCLGGPWPQILTPYLPTVRAFKCYTVAQRVLAPPPAAS